MLEVTQLSKRYGGLRAIDGASLSLSKDRIVALIGPNGAGKTTLFAAISGFVKPDSGTVVFNGENITAAPPHAISRKGLVRTFQITQPFMRLSVLENIMVGAYATTANRRLARDKAVEIASRVGMEHLLDMDSSGLTVAARKRLELARALATDPQLLLLDEVMAGLNPTEVAEIVEIVKKIQESGIGILLTEHVMQAVVALADDAYVLNNGRVIAHGALSVVMRDPAVIEAYLGEDTAHLDAGDAHA